MANLLCEWTPRPMDPFALLLAPLASAEVFLASIAAFAASGALRQVRIAVAWCQDSGLESLARRERGRVGS